MVFLVHPDEILDFCRSWRGVAPDLWRAEERQIIREIREFPLSQHAKWLVI